MADCFAGVWLANATDRGVLTERDVEDILVGVADSFSDPGHGSSMLRLWWLLQGFHLGPNVCFEPEPES
jgi:predicted metalloprotease